MRNKRFEIVLRNGRRASIERVFGEEAWGAAQSVGLGRDRWGSLIEFAENGPSTTWVAYLNVDGTRTPAGIAGYSRSDTERKTPEMAVMVAPAFRGVGLGTALFETLLLNALEHGLDHLVTQVPSRSSLVQRLEGRARSQQPAAQPEFVEFEIPVSSSQRTLVSSAATLPVIRPLRS